MPLLLAHGHDGSQTYEERGIVVQVAEMRRLLKNNTKYRNSQKWATKVDRMSDNQVIAVYMRMERAGEILK